MFCFLYVWLHTSVLQCTCSFSALYNPMLCLLYKAWQGVTKDKEIEKMSNLRFEGLDSLTDGGVYVTTDFPWVLSPTPMHPTWILLNQILADPPSSKDVSRLWAHLTPVAYLTPVALSDQLTLTNSSDLLSSHLWQHLYISWGEFFQLPSLEPPIDWT